MSFSFSNLSEALKTGAAISPQDVLDVRRWAWADGIISVEEAEAIFALNRAANDPPADWVDFFVEAIGEYVVNQRAPRGYVDDSNAEWLIAQIDRDGKVDTRSELELIVKVLEAALSAPAGLKLYALRQIEAIVTTGTGATRSGEGLRPGVVDEAEERLLRRLIFSAAGDSAVHVGREEAECLWRIKDACLEGDNAAGWTTLFAQALANHLLTGGTFGIPDRAEALRREAFINDHGSSMFDFLRRVGRSLSPDTVRDALSGQAEEEFEPGQRADGFDASEQAWLKQRLDEDAILDPYEQALVDFITRETGRRP